LPFQIYYLFFRLSSIFIILTFQFHQIFAFTFQLFQQLVSLKKLK
jgi:hypothetical protein